MSDRRILLSDKGIAPYETFYAPLPFAGGGDIF
ncbi:hypothetical protein I656_02419 [Geobacillus sp. WSUCF1]|nr:hypothetical protein I656_02419 [Geobacillus sp. WSUCF1]